MIDFEKICRTCSSEGELQSLFVEDQFLIADMLNQITNIKIIKNDNFPQNICSYCVDQLRTVYYFIQQCQDVYTKLQEYANTQVDCKLEESDEKIIEIKNEYPPEENNREFNSYTNFEFYVDKTDSISIEDINSDTVDVKSDDSDKASETKIQLVECEVCFKSLRQNGLRRHLKRHTAERSHTCSECAKDFISKMELKAHMRKHTDFKPFKCNHCEKSFKQRRSWLHHLNVTHLDIIEDKFPLKKRLQVHRTVECNICSKPIGSNNLRRHLQTHARERPFQCSNCDKSFAQKIQLQIHMRIHTGETPFKCNHCENAFRQRASLLYHLKTHHTEELKASPTGIFKCNICEEKFVNKIILASHKLLHTKGTRKIPSGRCTTKSHLCNHCGKVFVTNLHLQDHIGTHTGVKRHKCDICGKSFAAYSVYHVHRRRHLDVKPYKCNLCEKSFVTKKELNRHERTHTGERPFQCTICNQSFRNREHLKYHCYTHTGEKQITCSECDKRFYDMGSLNRHKKIHFKHFILDNTTTEHSYA